MKKIFTLIAAVAAFTSVNAQQLYLIGQSPLGNGWDPANVLAMDLASDGYTNSITVELTGTTYFAVCTGAGSDWTDMNTNLRWAPKSGDFQVTKGTYQLQKVEGTMVLTKGKYTLKVDARDMILTISTDDDVPTETEFFVAGNSSELFGNEWAGDDDNNKMEKQSDGSYKKTYDGVTLTAGDIMYKIVKNGAMWIPSGSDNNLILNIPEDGTYNVTFTIIEADPLDDSVISGEATSTTGISVTKVAQSVPTVYYNIAGQRVNANTKGVLIANGKKFVR